MNQGDIGVQYGETPYRPTRRKKKGLRPHPAKVCPGHLQLEDRPQEANQRSEKGHYEMNTVVSSINGKVGLLVLIDRCTRNSMIQLINSISKEAVHRALKKIMKENSHLNIKSVTTDNGCAFKDHKSIEKILKYNVYYTRAYASYEKGSVENCNRLVRRWYPKGTDLSHCTKSEIRALLTWINGIHKKSLDSMTVTQYTEMLSRAS